MAEHVDALTGMFAGRYAIEREAGRGATAIVYLARDVVTSNRVAVKVLRPEVLEAAGAEHFLREIRHHQRLEHPRILRVLDSGSADGRLFVVFPFMDGQTLRARLLHERQLPFADAIAITRDTAEALAGAHEAGLVHRDVKPENILFADGRAFLGDFGIARALERATGEATTSTGLVRGTPMYMSPEQASGETEYDGRSDLYSLGCVLYEMIAGVSVFRGPSAQSIIAQRLANKPASVALYRERVPVALDAVIDRVLMVSPADRFRRARDLVAALDLAAEALADPNAPTVPGARDSKRRRLTLVVATAVVAVLVMVLAWPRGPSREPGVIPDGDQRRIAVLYFDAMTPDVLPSSVADGITEDLIDRLGSVRALHVTSPNGVRRFRGGNPSLDSVARTLKVGTIVSGSVARSGDRLRVTVRFIDAATLRQVDSRVLEEQWSELFGLQDRLTEQVQFWLRQRLGDEIAVRVNRAGTRSVAAWEAAQLATEATRRAIQASTLRTDSTLAIHFFRADSLYVRAAQLDPDWIQPLVRRGNLALQSLALLSPRAPEGVDSLAYYHMTRAERRTAWTRRAGTLADEALRRRPRDVAALTLRGQVTAALADPELASHDSLLAAAERDLRAALLVRPDLATASAAMADLSIQRGHFSEAAEFARRAFETDAFFELRRVLDVAFTASLYAEQFDDARRWCAVGLRHYAGDPRFSECELRLLGSVGQTSADVRAAWSLVNEIERRDTLQMLGVTWGFRRLMVASILARGGQSDSARRVVQTVLEKQPEAARRSSELALCLVYTLLGERTEAVQRLRALMRARPAPRFPLPMLPWFKTLRGDPQFDALLAPRT